MVHAGQAYTFRFAAETAFRRAYVTATACAIGYAVVYTPRGTMIWQCSAIHSSGVRILPTFG